MAIRLRTASHAWCPHMRVGMMRLVREADEMQARKVMEALVVSAAGTVITSIAYSLLEEVGAPHVGLTWVGGAWALFFGVGMLWSTWRYR